MVAIANVTLTDTFDNWRTKTNQLINLYDETNLLARSSYNATNLAVVTAANISANIISGNSAVYNTIYDNANTITYNIMSTLTNTTFVNLYSASNAAFNVANAALATSNLTYDQANTARDTSNSATSFVIGYSSNTNNTINSYFDSMNVDATITRTIANNAYDTANNFVANSSNIVAGILASNTIIQNTINTTVTILFDDYLANNDLTYVGGIANAAFLKANTGDTTGIDAYNTANAAFNKANTAGGGYFVGNDGYRGNANNVSDLFRINANTMTGNITFAAGENASATGPLYMAANTKMTIQTGARVVII